jgi:hypothetical protein
MSTTHNYSMDIVQSIGEPVIESAISLATIQVKNLTNLTVATSPAVVNFGIYNIINRFNKPSIIIFGTEAAVLLTLNCAQGNPLNCLSSFVNIDSLQAVSQIALENLGTGVTYALGEEVAQKAIALSRGNASGEIASTLLTTLAASGLGFYAWSMDPSLAQSMITSMSSAIILTSLTSASNQPGLKGIQQKITDSLSGVSSQVGKILGVATIAVGTAALAYQKTSAEAVLGAVINATKQVVSPNALASAQNMIRANYSWIEGYRWTKNMFKKWSY